MKRKLNIQRLSFCALIFMSFLLIGCFPIPVISKKVAGVGSEYSKEQVAIIKGSKYRFFISYVGYVSSGAKIQKVDNEYYDADEVRIPSGLHEVWIIIEKRTFSGGYFGIGGSDNRDFRSLYFKFDTEAGHTYKVDIPLYWRKNSIINIIDKTTNEVVCSQVAGD